MCKATKLYWLTFRRWYLVYYAGKFIHSSTYQIIIFLFFLHLQEINENEQKRLQEMQDLFKDSQEEMERMKDVLEMQKQRMESMTVEASVMEAKHASAIRKMEAEYQINMERKVLRRFIAFTHCCYLNMASILYRVLYTTCCCCLYCATHLNCSKMLVFPNQFHRPTCLIRL